MVSLNIQYKKEGLGLTNSFNACSYFISRHFLSQKRLKFTSYAYSSQFFIWICKSAFCSLMSRSRSFSFFFFSCKERISLSIYSFIIWYRFCCWISSCSMMRRKDFSRRSISSLNFLRTFSSNLLQYYSYTKLSRRYLKMSFVFYSYYLDALNYDSY